MIKDGKSNISILIEWEVIQEIFLKVDDNMKLHIKEQLRKIENLETTYLKPLSQLVKTNAAPKKVKSSPSDNSTMRSPSYFEHVDTLFFGFSNSKISKSVFKDARISKSSLTPYLPKIEYIEEMLVFMHKYIE